MNLHGLAHVDAGDGVQRDPQRVLRGRCDGVIIVVLGQVDEEEVLAHTVVAMRESLVAVEAEF